MGSKYKRVFFYTQLSTTDLTKRSVLSDNTRVFDPSGLLTPTALYSKAQMI